jgi:hypothetical protein
MEAVRTSETSVDNNFTRQYIPEDNFEHYGKNVWIPTISFISDISIIGTGIRWNIFVKTCMNIALLVFSYWEEEKLKKK